MFEKNKIRYKALKHLLTKDVKQLPKKFLFYMMLLSRYEKLTIHDGKYVISSDLPPFPSEAFNRAIRSLHSISTGKVIPIYSSISITNNCPYNCWHCFINNLKEDEMSADSAKKIIRALQDVGVSVIAFTGGEPLLRSDLCEIISSIDHKKSSSILFTTGYGLTRKKAKELKKAGLFGIIIGLEHSQKQIQDQLRNTKGAYDHAINGLRNAKDANLYVSISIVATKERIRTGEIWDFIKFAGGKGVDEVLVLEPIPVGKIISKDDFLLNEIEREQVINLQKKANKSRKYPRVLSYPYKESRTVMGCTAGYHYVHVSASGNICPCSFTPLSFGNALQEDLRVILKRLNNAFHTPRNRCFMLKNHQYVSKHIDNGFVPYPKSAHLCNSCSQEDVPLLYKKLGVKI